MTILALGNQARDSRGGRILPARRLVLHVDIPATQQEGVLQLHGRHAPLIDFARSPKMDPDIGRLSRVGVLVARNGQDEATLIQWPCVVNLLRIDA